MSDLIRVVDLEVQAHIGVTEEERAHPQRLLISIEISVESLARAARSDNVLATVNYFDVTQRIKNVIAERPRKLLETLAEVIASDLLKAYPMKRVTLEIKKFVLPDAQYVSVKIDRLKGLS